MCDSKYKRENLTVERSVKNAPIQSRQFNAMKITRLLEHSLVNVIKRVGKFAKTLITLYFE